METIYRSKSWLIEAGKIEDIPFVVCIDIKTGAYVNFSAAEWIRVADLIKEKYPHWNFGYTLHEEIRVH